MGGGASTNRPYASVEEAKKAGKTQSEIDVWLAKNQHTDSNSTATTRPLSMPTNNSMPSPSDQRTECLPVSTVLYFHMYSMNHYIYQMH